MYDLSATVPVSAIPDAIGDGDMLVVHVAYPGAFLRHHTKARAPIGMPECPCTHQWACAEGSDLRPLWQPDIDASLQG